jgi:hypothetical protein
MPTSLQSPYPNILPFLETIPKPYWKSLPGGSILLSKKVGWAVADIDNEYLYLLAYGPEQGTVTYTGDSIYAQFSEVSTGYNGQCVALAKAISGKRNMATDKWLPWQSLWDFCNTPDSILPSSYQWLIIAYFDGKPNYALANPAKKHVAILLDIVRDSSWKPKSIIVIDQNYYSYAPYQKYAGRIAKHSISWWTVIQKWVAAARSYNIVTI